MIYFIKKILLSVLQKSLKLLYINMLYLSNTMKSMGAAKNEANNAAQSAPVEKQWKKQLLK